MDHDAASVTTHPHEDRVVQRARRQCHLCPRRFAKTEHLERHIRSHTKETPFQCRCCGRRYRRNDTLLRHIRTQRCYATVPPVLDAIEVAHGVTTDTDSGSASATAADGAPVSQRRPTAAGHDDRPVDSNCSPLAAATADDLVTTMAESENVGEQLHGHAVADHHNPPVAQLTNPRAALVAPLINEPVVANNAFPKSTVAAARAVANPQVSPSPPQDLTPNLFSWLNWTDSDAILQEWPVFHEDTGPQWPSLSGPNALEAAMDHGSERAVVPDLRHHWYTHLDSTVLGETDEPAVLSPAALPQQHGEVDEAYRQSLRCQLHIRQSNEKIPSTKSLNLCISAYFEHFHPVFPIIHRPSFKPSKSNAVLLLSMFSIGSLFTGMSDALRTGKRLFESLNKVIVSKWETMLGQGTQKTLPIIQAALLGQTYGLMSGHAQHLALVESFHGTVISWARRSQMLNTPSSHFAARYPLPAHDESGEEWEELWRTWISEEESTRVALGLRIHDAELATVFDHEPLLPRALRSMPTAAPAALFDAPTAREWSNQLYSSCPSATDPSLPSSVPPCSFDGLARSSSSRVDDPCLGAEGKRMQTIPDNSEFTLFTALESLSSTIHEARHAGFLSETLTEKFAQTLIAFYKRHLRSCDDCGRADVHEISPLRRGVHLLWHLNMLTLWINLDVAERSLGRDGPLPNASDLDEIKAWVRSSLARRCIAHAMLILAIIEAMPLREDPAMNVPRALFLAGSCLACYSRFKPPGAVLAPLDILLFPEFECINSASTAVFHQGGIGHSLEHFETLIRIADTLQRIGHWNLSRKLAHILGLVIQDEMTTIHP